MITNNQEGNHTHLYPVVPSGQPQGIVGTALSSTRLQISWGPPLTGERNGVIRHYKIVVLEVETGEREREYAYPSPTSQIFYSQHPYYRYEITIAAYTIGYGPSSSAITVQMPEAGK